MRVTIFFLSILFYLTSEAQSFYHEYYYNMISTLRTTLMDRDTLWLKELPKSSYVDSDTIFSCYRWYQKPLNLDLIENCVSGKSDDARLFYEFSMTLIDSLFYDRKICTKNEIDSIESWWKRNEMVITPDFLRDILWTMGTVFNYLDGWEFYFKSEHQDSAIQRIFDRIANRQKKKFSTTKTNSYLLNPKHKEWFEYLLSIQDSIQHVFTDHIIIESIIPRNYHSTYVYTLKKLMTGESYNPLTPVSRNEFEDMRDWWFINIDTIDFEKVRKYFYFYNFDEQSFP